MLKREVEIGREYVAKVSGKIAVVRILRQSPHGGWEAVNEQTGRAVRIRTAARLRRAANQEIAARSVVATEQRIAADWQKAKEASLASGYATQWDRRTARTIRQRQAEGIDVTEAQLAFAERVEEIVRAGT